MALKRSLKVFTLFFFICVVCFVSVCAYVLVNGRAIILAELEKKLGAKPKISSFYIMFPASIVVKDFVIGENIRVDKIVIVPSLLGFLKGDIVLNSCVLDKPYFKIIRKADETFDFGIVLAKKQEDLIQSEKPAPQENIPVSQSLPKSLKKAKQKQNFYLKRLKINNATVDFIDEAVVPGESFRLRLDHFCLNIFQASFLDLSRMRLNALGCLKSQQGVAIGNIDLAGWFDLLARDMDMKASLKDARLAYLGPYYLKFFKRELESGNMKMSADLKSDKNNLKADCHVELDQVAFKDNGQLSGENSLDIGDFVSLAFGSVLSAQGKIIFDFSVQTKMDHPRFENVRFKGTFFESSMKTIISKGPQVATHLATGGVKEAVGDFKEVGKKFEDFGKQFKGIFKKD